MVNIQKQMDSQFKRRMLFLIFAIQVSGHELKRMLYDTSTNGDDCDRCLDSGKNHCWDFQASGEGSWYKSYCCGPSDRICNGLDYCSNKVSGDKKLMSCPMSSKIAICPTASESVIQLSKNDFTYKRKEGWTNLEIRENGYCKYKIDYQASIPRNSFGTLNLKIDSSNVPTWVIKQSDKIFDETASIQKLNFNSQTLQFKNVNEKQQYWIIYNTRAYKEGSIHVEAWVQVEYMDSQEAARVEEERRAQEEAEEERIAEEQAAQAERLEQEAEAKALQEAEEERRAQEQAEAEMLAREKAEEERIAAERLEQEKAEAERLAAKKAEQERIAAQQLAQEKAEAERLAAEKLAQEKAEAERLAAEKLAQEKAEAERLAAEKLAQEQADQKAADEAAAQAQEEARIKAQQDAAAKAAAEEAAQAEAKAAEEARIQAEQEAAAKAAAEQAEVERLAEEQRLAAEKLAQEKAEAEKLVQEKADADRLAAEKLAQEEAQKAAEEKAKADMLAAEKEVEEAKKAEAERLAKEKEEEERLAAEKLAQEKTEAERLEQEKAEADRLAAEKLAQEQAEAQRLAAEKAEAEKIAEEKASQDQSNAVQEKEDQEDLSTDEQSDQDSLKQELEILAAEKQRIELEQQEAAIAAEQEKIKLQQEATALELAKNQMEQKAIKAEADRLKLQQEAIAAEVEKLKLQEKSATTQAEKIQLEKKLAEAEGQRMELEKQIQEQKKGQEEAAKEIEKQKKDLEAAQEKFRKEKEAFEKRLNEVIVDDGEVVRELTHNGTDVTSPFENPLNVPEDELDNFGVKKNQQPPTNVDQQPNESSSATIPIIIGMILSSIISIILIYFCRYLKKKKQDNTVEDHHKPKDHQPLISLQSEHNFISADEPSRLEQLSKILQNAKVDNSLIDIENLLTLQSNNEQMSELQKHLTAVQQELLIKELANALLRPKNGSGLSGREKYERSPQISMEILPKQEIQFQPDLEMGQKKTLPKLTTDVGIASQMHIGITKVPNLITSVGVASEQFSPKRTFGLVKMSTDVGASQMQIIHESQLEFNSQVVLKSPEPQLPETPDQLDQILGVLKQMTPVEIQKVVRDVSRSQSFQKNIEDMNTSRINAEVNSNFEDLPIQSRELLHKTSHKISDSNIFEESQKINLLDQQQQVSPVEFSSSSSEYSFETNDYEEESQEIQNQNSNDASNLLAQTKIKKKKKKISPLKRKILKKLPPQYKEKVVPAHVAKKEREKKNENSNKKIGGESNKKLNVESGNLQVTKKPKKQNEETMTRYLNTNSAGDLELQQINDGDKSIVDQIKSLNFEKSHKDILKTQSSIDFQKLKNEILHEDGNKEGGSPSDTDSVILRFRQEMKSMDKTITKSEFAFTPRSEKEEEKPIRKVSSEVKFEGDLTVVKNKTNLTDFKCEESPSTMQKINAPSVFQSNNVADQLDQIPNDSMTKTPNYDFTPNAAEKVLLDQNSGSIKKFKDDDSQVQLKIAPIVMKVDDKSTPSLRAHSSSLRARSLSSSRLVRKSLDSRIGSATSKYLSQKGMGDVIVETEESVKDSRGVTPAKSLKKAKIPKKVNLDDYQDRLIQEEQEGQEEEDQELKQVMSELKSQEEDPELNQVMSELMMAKVEEEPSQDPSSQTYPGGNEKRIDEEPQTHPAPQEASISEEDTQPAIGLHLEQQPERPSAAPQEASQGTQPAIGLHLEQRGMIQSELEQVEEPQYDISPVEKDENPPPQERETPASEEPTQIVMGVHLADEPNRDLVSFANKHDDPQKSVSFADPRILHNSSPLDQFESINEQIEDDNNNFDQNLTKALLNESEIIPEEISRSSRQYSQDRSPFFAQQSDMISISSKSSNKSKELKFRNKSLLPDKNLHSHARKHSELVSKNSQYIPSEILSLQCKSQNSGSILNNQPSNGSPVKKYSHPFVFQQRGGSLISKQSPSDDIEEDVVSKLTNAEKTMAEKFGFKYQKMKAQDQQIKIDIRNKIDRKYSKANINANATYGKFHIKEKQIEDDISSKYSAQVINIRNDSNKTPKHIRPSLNVTQDFKYLRQKTLRNVGQTLSPTRHGISPERRGPPNLQLENISSFGGSMLSVRSNVLRNSNWGQNN